MSILKKRGKEECSFLDIEKKPATEALYRDNNDCFFYFTGNYIHLGAESERHAVILFDKEKEIKKGYGTEDLFNNSRRVSGRDILSIINE